MTRRLAWIVAFFLAGGCHRPTPPQEPAQRCSDLSVTAVGDQVVLGYTLYTRPVPVDPGGYGGEVTHVHGWADVWLETAPGDRRTALCHVRGRVIDDPREDTPIAPSDVRLPLPPGCRRPYADRLVVAELRLHQDRGASVECQGSAGSEFGGDGRSAEERAHAAAVAARVAPAGGAPTGHACDQRGTFHSCTDYPAGWAGDLFDAQQRCGNESGTWSAGACDRAGATGLCAVGGTFAGSVVVFYTGHGDASEATAECIGGFEGSYTPL